MLRTSCVLVAAFGLVAAAPEAGWRALAPDNTLIIDTTKGRIVVEMRPELAPKAVERIRLLAREGVYDGLQFHRVIEGFVDQTGNPNNRDGGTSRHPDLGPEFQFRLPPADVDIAVERSDGFEAFVGATPVAGAKTPDGRLRGWGAYCAGVAGMGRQADPGSANSEIFFMRAPARRLDHEYTVWGRVVVGLDVVRAIAVGEPPPSPDRMLRVRVATDIAPADRPRVEVEAGAALAQRLARLKRSKGAAFSICDVELASRVR